MHRVSSLKCQSARLYRIAEHVKKRAMALKGLEATSRFLSPEAVENAEGEIKQDLADLAEWLNHCHKVLEWRQELVGELPEEPDRNLFYGL